MHFHSGLGRKWRRLSHKYGEFVFLVCVVGGLIALVGLLIYMLTSGEWRGP